MEAEVRLWRKIAGIALSVLVVLSAMVFLATPVEALHVYESYTSGDDDYSGPYGTNILAQTFTPSAHTVVSVSIKAYRIGTPGNQTVSIKAVDGSGNPTGAALATVTLSANAWTTDTAGAWYECTFTNPYTFPGATQFAITVSGGTDASNRIGWRSDWSGPSYTGGTLDWYNGSIWTQYGADNMFQENGCVAATVVTGADTSVGATWGVVAENVTNTGYGTISSWGTQYGTTTSYGSNVTSTGANTTAFGWSDNLTGLVAGTLYHYRGFAINQAGIAYGADDNFTAGAGPTVTSVSSTSIAATSALLTGNITDTGGFDADWRGFQWGTSSGVYTDNWTEAGSFGTGTYTHTITLSAGTLYYWRSVAHNTLGTGYGAENTFLTLPLPPSAFTATSVNETTISLAFTAGTGSDTTLIRGKLGSAPTTRADGAYSYNGTATPQLHTGLSAGNHWYYIAYSSKTAGGYTQYSATPDMADDVTTAGPPVVTTDLMEGHGHDWLIVKGTITSGAPVTSVGFDYGLTDAYGSSVTKTVSLTDGDSFVMTIPDLNPGTPYYVRAKASNGGWGYGDAKRWGTSGSYSLYEYMAITGDNDSQNIYSNNWTSQSFTVTDPPHSVGEVRLVLKRVGNPGTITVVIKHSSAGMPTGLDLASGTLDGDTISTSYVQYAIPVDETDLAYGEEYAIVVKAIAGDGTNYVKWHKLTAGTDNMASYSTDGGSTWSTQTSDYNFEVWGDASMRVIGGGAFSAFVDDTGDGDLLFTGDVENTVAPYYPDQLASTAFTFRLYDTDGTTLLASTPLVDWGRRPASIYLSADAAASITRGGALYLKMVGNTNPTYEIASYALQTDDWYGSNLVQLDQWCVRLATNMELEYTGSDFITYVSGKGYVLSEDGGVEFDRGIPGLSYVRGLTLFKVVVHTYTHDIPDYVEDYAAAHPWSDTTVGTETADFFTAAGALIGVGGAEAAGLSMLIIWIGIGFLSGSILWGMIATLPLSWYAMDVGVLPPQVAAVGLGILGLVIVYNLWLNK